MKDYLVSSSGRVHHYFFRKNEGICVCEVNAALRTEHRVVHKTDSEVFCALGGDNGIIHIISADSTGNITYIIFRSEVYRSYLISKPIKRTDIRRLEIFFAGGRLNMAYSAEIEGELQLVHCVLGNNAKPHTVDKLSGEEFFVGDEGIYYVNADGAMGFCEASDGIPGSFEPICEGASVPYIYEGHTVYKRDGGIYFDGKRVYEEQYAEAPILIKNENQLLIMWQTGDFVRYIASPDGTSWSNSMQYISPGRKPTLFAVSRGGRSSRLYGYYSSRELHIFAKTSPFEEEAAKNTAEMDFASLERLKFMVDMLRNELIATKNELDRINKIIEQGNE